MRKAPWAGWFPRRGQKLAEYRGGSGKWVSIPFITCGRCPGFDPLKQFAPVIRGNHPAQGRIAMGLPPPGECRQIDLFISPRKTMMIPEKIITVHTYEQPETVSRFQGGRSYFQRDGPGSFATFLDRQEK